MVKKGRRKNKKRRKKKKGEGKIGGRRREGIWERRPMMKAE